MTETESLEGKERGQPGIHAHPHRHAEGERPHAHPHHHTRAEVAHVERCSDGITLAHDHGHGLAFERYTYLCSPVHLLDPRTKVLGALAWVAAVVISPPPRLVELAALAALLVAVVVMAGVPPAFVIKRSAFVVPFAGAVALFAPLARSPGSLSWGGLAGSYAAGGWLAAYAILAKAWLTAFIVVVLSTTTPVPALFEGLRRLGLPAILLTMLSFTYRYLSVMRQQVAALRTAVESRGPGLGRLGRLRLYGNLAGAMFIRAFERGERVYDAMVSRGYEGTLPSGTTLRFGGGDALALAVVSLSAAAVLLY